MSKNSNKMDQIKGLIFGEEMSLYESKFDSLKTEVEDVFNELNKLASVSTQSLEGLKEQLLSTMDANEKLVQSQISENDKKINTKLESLESSMNEKLESLQVSSMSKAEFSDLMLEISSRYKGASDIRA